MNLSLQGSVSTCCGPVVGGLVWSTVDETSQAGHSVSAHQDVAAEGSAVHHPDVERRMEKLVFWKVLWLEHQKPLSLRHKIQLYKCS